jgi:DNA-directed RNA polymerase specialized sigma24 family protein
LRGTLLRVFRWRGAVLPEELADEALLRVERKVSEGVEVGDVRLFALGVARLLLLEEMKDRVRHERALDEWKREIVSPPRRDDRRMAALERCLERLDPENRALLLEYYTGERSMKIDNRRRIAERLGIPLPSLRIRVHRLRERLEKCVGGL